MGKKYTDSAALVDREVTYSPEAAIELLKKAAYAKFDESVELHFQLGVDPRHADQQLRGTLVLPNGTGKDKRVAVIASGDKVQAALDAGANEAGGEDLIEKISGGWFDFDVLVATPDMMAKVGKLGRVLGSKGLMPNPKSGTVTPDVAKAVSEFKSGKVEYRNDKYGNIHVVIGKTSFDADKLFENFDTIYETLMKVKPQKAKGVYMKSISLASTMGPGIWVETQKLKWNNN